mgnify:CR=1 FL=1
MNETDLLKLKSLNACPECDLSGADLRGANLAGANLSGADLRGAKLDNADLRSGDLSNADLRSGDLSEGIEDPDPDLYLITTTLRNAKLDGVKYWKTKMPWGEVSDELVVTDPEDELVVTEPED